MSVDTHFLPNVLNCYDESALELALRLKEKNAEAELSAITVGGKREEPTLNTLLALGYCHAVKAPVDEKLFRFHPDRTARALAAYNEACPQDLILLGQEAPLGNSSAVPALASLYTGYPLITSVIDIPDIREEAVTLRAVRANEVIEIRAALPCVAVIGNAVISKLRVPTLRDRMKSREKKIETFQAEDEIAGSSLTPVKLETVSRLRAGRVSAQKGCEAIMDVYRESLKERLGAL